LLAFQSISPADDLELAADGFFDRDDRSYLEHEGRKHRTELVNGHEVVALEQHVSAPFANAYHEEFDLEIGGGFPLTEYLENSLLGILVLDRRALRALEPADHVFHWHPPNRVDSQPGNAVEPVRPRSVRQSLNPGAHGGDPAV